jgi:uncharacterized membrane-anchored protein YitT (DUF2179 family)
VVTLGSAAVAVSVSLVMKPFNIVPGGFAGLAILIRSKWDLLPVGALTLIMNVPLLVLSFVFLGRRFLFGTVYGAAASSLLIDLAARLKPLFAPDTDLILVAVAGGVMMGAGLALVFARGATTGGSDIAARLLKLIFPHVQIGKIMFAFDGILVLMSMLAFSDVKAGLYAAIGLFIGSRVMDLLLYGVSTERVAYIISGSYREIAREIDSALGRGCTFLLGEGAYSGEPRRVALCAVKRQQVSLLKRIVVETDPDAFMILMEAGEVLGEGFKRYDNHGL